MVYACKHRELAGHLVAMKVLFPEVAQDEIAAARFRNEIVASYGVSHPNVVRAYEYFKDGDLLAYTMEFVSGGDLADKLDQEELMDYDEILKILIQMCSGISAVHDAGIVHRDMKPENILLTPEGDVKITDFGIARRGDGPKLTEHDGVLGTIDYVSPEYLEKGLVDKRSDLYAIGVLAFEMITKQAPFQGSSVVETMTMRLRSDPPSPSQYRSDCPKELEAFVLKALKRDPDKRYQSAIEMLDDLEVIDIVSQDSIKKSNKIDSYLDEEDEFLSSSVKIAIDKDADNKKTFLVDDDAIPESQNIESKDLEENKNSENLQNQQVHPTKASSLGLEKIEFASGSFRNFVNKQQNFTGSDSTFSEEHSEIYKVRPPTFESKISVSNSGLASSRLKELSKNSQQQEHFESNSLLSDILLMFFVVFLGFGLGFYFLRYYQPNLHGNDRVNIEKNNG